MDVTKYFVFYPLSAFGIVVLVIVVYAIVSTSLKSNVNKKLRDGGVETVGVITKIRSKPGENSAYINVELTVCYEVSSLGKAAEGQGSAVIDVTKIPDYQPGKEIRLIYNEKDLGKIFPLVPNPLFSHDNKMQY